MFGFIRAFLTGNSFTNQLVTGDFDRESQVGRTYSVWFDEKPARAEQRRLFVSLAGNFGGSRAYVANLLNGIIVKAMSGEVAFGDALARELEGRLSLDAPKTREQALAQQKAKQDFADAMAEFRALDA